MKTNDPKPYPANRPGFRKMIRSILFGGLAICLSGCTALQHQNPPPLAQADAAQEQQLTPEQKEKIFKTLKQAAQSGKSDINIYLDENPDLIQLGDLVVVDVTAGTKDGLLINTTLENVANQKDRKWLIGQGKSEGFHPVEVIAGEEQGFPGVNDTVIGMKKGEQKVVTIPSEKAYGEKDPQKIQKYPSVRRIPRMARAEPLGFVQQYGIFPVKGNQISFNPYLNAKITDVVETAVALELSMKPEEEMEKVRYGKTIVTLDNDEFLIKLKPEIGALFELEKQKGIITEAGEDTFTVDFNHPMAGKPMVLEVKVLDFTKASIANTYEISWLDDYQKGMDASLEQNKPVVLLLYAGWCQWSRKMMEDVLQDPRILRLHDDFIWVKIDSDKHREYKEGFDQTSYPKLLILNSRGEVLKSLDGYNNVHIVSELLHEIQPVSKTG
ncbi:MAG: thioredoxin family protein [Pseudomonadota bacterium]